MSSRSRCVVVGLTFLVLIATASGVGGDQHTQENPCVEPEEATETSPCTPLPPLDDQLCDLEQPPVLPPVKGRCDIELHADWLAFAEGQGFSEGKAEASVSFALTDSLVGTTITQRFPARGSYKMKVDSRRLLSTRLKTYRVREGNTRDVEVCATFREHDGEVIDINGDDDVGTDCDTVTLTCPQPSAGVNLRAGLCRGGDCDQINGAMAARVRILRKDADGDCVENECDWTPDLCDEANKGQLCRASLVYFYFGDGAATTLFQNLGTRLSKAMRGYDVVTLLIDDAQIGPFGLNPAALELADVLMEPSEQAFFASLQALTARGCDIDTWIFSHGSPVWSQEGGIFRALDASIEAIADDDPGGEPDITTAELARDTDPANSGTPSIPVRMTYSVACYYQLWNRTWIDAGAKVTSGSTDINFFPTYFGNFADNWDAGQSYGESLADEFAPLDQGVALGFVQAQGSLPPWWCVGNTVRGRNACAEDFFVDSDELLEPDADGNLVDGPDEAAYEIGGPREDTVGIAYDPGASGEDNMIQSSVKVLAGTPDIRKNVPATLIWP